MPAVIIFIIEFDFETDRVQLAISTSTSTRWARRPIPLDSLM